MDDFVLFGEVVDDGLAFFLESDCVADQLQALGCESGRLELHDVQCEH